MPSHAHCSPLASAGICTHLPITLLCLLLPPTLLCPLFPSGIPRHLHSYPFCLSLTSAGTDTHIPNIPFPHAHFGHLRPLTQTSLWPLQVATLMCPLPSSGLCKHLPSSAYCASVASASTYTHMTNADLALHSHAHYLLGLFSNLQSHAPVPSGLCRHLHSKSHCPHLTSSSTCTDMTIVCLASAGTCTHIPTAHQTVNSLTDNSL